MRAVIGLSLLIACPVLAADPVPAALEDPAHSDPYIAPGVQPRQPRGVIVHGPFVSLQVNTDPATGMDIIGDAANEPSLAAQFDDPSKIVIGWRQFDTIASNWRRPGYAYSHDGGAGWSGKLVIGEVDGDLRRGSDPVLRAGPDGHIYYNTYRAWDTPFDTDVYSTLDGGLTWDGPFGAKGGDKAWMTVDRTDGPDRGVVYQFWSDSANYSRDNGQTWSQSAGFTPRWGQMEVGPDGRAYIAGSWLQLVEPHPTNPLGRPTLRNLADFPYFSPGFSSSPVNPGGLEGQNNISINTAPGPRFGELYGLQSSVGLDGLPATPGLDVYFTWSTDLGETFDGVTRVNDDAESSAWHWFGTMSIAPNGRIDAVWNDTRDDPDPLGSPDTSRLYASYSTDGGRTWAPNFPVSPSYEHGIGYPNQNKLGDYYDMYSDNVTPHIAYAATFLGGQDVYYLTLATADCDNNGVGDEMEIAAGLALDANGDWVLDACQCLPDLNGDGFVNFADVLAFIDAFIAGDALADINGDGLINFADTTAFIDGFIAGC